MTSIKIQQKREKVRDDILKRAIPFIKDGTYSQLTIRELCEKMGITTGMFYRSYKSKNDLLASFTLETSRTLYEEAELTQQNLSLKDKLLQICYLSLQSAIITGPDSALTFLEIYNENSSQHYLTSQSMFHKQIYRAFENSQARDKFSTEDIKHLADTLYAVEAGLCFEWYIMRNDENYDIQTKFDSVMKNLIKNLNLPDDL